MATAAARNANQLLRIAKIEILRVESLFADQLVKAHALTCVGLVPSANLECNDEVINKIEDAPVPLVREEYSGWPPVRPESRPAPQPRP